MAIGRPFSGHKKPLICQAGSAVRPLWILLPLVENYFQSSKLFAIVQNDFFGLLNKKQSNHLIMNEEKLEDLCLDWFCEGGWDVLYGPNIAPDKVNGEAREGALGHGTNPQRDDYAQVILKHDLEAAFTRINPRLPQACFKQVVSKLSQAEIWTSFSITGVLHHTPAAGFSRFISNGYFR